MSLHHLVNEVECTITCSLWTEDRATPFSALTCEHTLELVSQFTILTEEVTNFTTTNTDIACRNILVRTDVTIQLVHESLAETHDFSIALTTWREVRTTLTTTHRQCGECILECLLETEELQDAEVY